MQREDGREAAATAVGGPRTLTIDGGEQDEAPAPFPVGHVLANRYRLLEEIGRGGFAFVYRAHDLDLAQDIALKILRPDRLSRANRERLRREATVTRGLHSPRLVRVFDLQSTEGQVFVTMELVRGGTLRDRLNGGRLPVEESTRIAGEILEALMELHGAGVVHRDLKPSNVLLDPDGHVRLADFGLVSAVEGRDVRVTETFRAIGTLEYVAPEQLRAQAVDGRSDLFSLGVVIYEMLVGRPPFAGESWWDTAQQRVVRAAPSACAKRPEAPPWVGRFVGRLLQREPADRYASAEAALMDLRATRGPRAWSRRRRRWAAAVGLVFAFFAAALSWSWRREPPLPLLRPLGEGPRAGVEAVDGAGRQLWILPGISSEVASQMIAVHREDGERRVLAAVLAPGDRFGPEDTRVLSFLDPRDGRVLERVDLPVADWATNAGYHFSDTFKLRELRAVDIDADGVEELLATFTHMPLAPAYTVYYDPRLRRAWIAYATDGHHRLGALADLDGDGVVEAIFTGVASQLGHGPALAAMRFSPALSPMANGPELREFPGGNLLWYALAPPGDLATVEVDVLRRRIDLLYTGRPAVAWNLEGFDQAIGEETVRERAAGRLAAYASWREALRLSASGTHERALDMAARGRDQARVAGDRMLAEAVELLRARVLVRADRVGEARSAFTGMIERGFVPISETAYVAARELHLAGYVGASLPWYRQSARAFETGPRRTSQDAVLGLIVALDELGRSEEAEAEVGRLALDPSGTGWDRLLFQYHAWRQGTLSPIDATASLRGADDSALYLQLEYAHALGGHPDDTLARVEKEIPHSSTTRGPLWSLAADLLLALGRSAEALDAARRGFEYFKLESRSDVLSRGLAGLGAERLARAARASGLEQEARDALAAAAAIRRIRAEPAE